MYRTDGADRTLPVRSARERRRQEQERGPEEHRCLGAMARGTRRLSMLPEARPPHTRALQPASIAGARWILASSMPPPTRRSRRAAWFVKEREAKARVGGWDATVPLVGLG